MHLSSRRFARSANVSPSKRRPCADPAKRASQNRSYSIHVHIRSSTQVARPLPYASGPRSQKITDQLAHRAWQAPAAHVPLLPTRDSPTPGESFRRLLLAVVAVGMGAASVTVVDKAGRGHVQLRTHHQFAKMSVSHHRRARDAPASPRPALAHGRCKDTQRRHNKGHDAPCPCSRAPSSGRRTGQCRRVRSSCPRRARREEGPAPPMPWGAGCHRTARPRGTRASHRPCHLQGRHAAMIRSESRERGLDVQLGGDARMRSARAREQQALDTGRQGGGPRREPPEAQRPGSLAPGCATVAIRPDRAVAHVGQGVCGRAGSTTRPLERRRGAHR